MQRLISHLYGCEEQRNDERRDFRHLRGGITRRIDRDTSPWFTNDIQTPEVSFRTVRTPHLIEKNTDRPRREARTCAAGSIRPDQHRLSFRLSPRLRKREERTSFLRCRTSHSCGNGNPPSYGSRAFEGGHGFPVKLGMILGGAGKERRRHASIESG